MERFSDIIELQDLLRQALELNAALVAENAALRERVADLEARLKKDSSNSGKPPSSDGFRKPAPKSQRQKSGRKPGGQSGHKGSGLATRAEPSETVDIPAPTSCHACGCDLRSAVLAEAVEERQVIGFKIIPWVTEYRSESKRCPDCGAVAAGAFPDGVNARAQYGSEVKSLAMYLVNRQYLPYRRAAETLGRVFGVKVSAGTLVAWQASLGQGLSGAVEAIRGAVAKAPVACFDETSLRAEKANHWVHVATTPSVVFYHFDAKRGREAMDRVGVLPNFNGVAIHDRLKSYETYSCKHAYCWDHLKRDLTYLAEQRGWKWAKETLVLFKKMYRACQKPIEKRKRHGYKSLYGRLLAKAELENPLPPSGTYRSERKKESRRLQNALKQNGMTSYARWTIPILRLRTTWRKDRYVC